ncbi:MAG: carbon-nitrogen hydrolase family protein [Planctomycetota bacterium]
MLIACVQTDVKIGNVDHNTDRVLDWLSKAAAEGAQLVVFPECMLTGYCFESRQEALEHAVEVDAQPIRAIAKASKQLGLTVTLGSLVQSSLITVQTDGAPVTSQQGLDEIRLTNSALLFDQGHMIARYDKVHLPNLGVDRFVDRGREPYQSQRTSLPESCRVGLAICYDCSFPEPMRALALDGTDVIALGTNWPAEAVRTAAIVPPARSMENHLYFVAANRVGHERGFDFCGNSSICGPDGIELAHSHDDKETLLLGEADPNKARLKRIERTVGRHSIDRFADRQPEFYGIVSDPAVKEQTQ